ncbi:MAG TPA: peptidoglycan-binding domain-containing protein [Anaerolineales bacterium]|nr:peptidoglycan-binding domain-containing protein [Anaerolineales bacterium]
MREYQHILQDLVYYSGNVDGDDGPLTDSAVRTFQGDKGLTVDGIVGDQTWAALIDTYLSQDALAVPESQFLPNAKDGCDGGILKWLGCGEQDPVRNTQDAWRPNRRTELLFVSADALPCEVPQPDTFDLPSPRAVNNTWCLGPGDPNQRCCFVTRDTEQPGKWLVQPAEPGTITVRGRITFDDGTPVANARYVLIAPDGEFMDGETPAGSHRGEGIPGRTGVDGAFEYPDKPKDIGTYTLDIQGPFVARLEGEPSEAARGNVVCKRLDGSSDFNVIVCTPAVTFDLQVTDAVQIGGSASRTFLATRALSGDVIVTAVFPSGMCTAPRSITWTGGEEVPGNPLQRRVPRATVAQTTVTAMMPSTGMSKSVTIMVITVQLEAVKFNHDPTAATTDALNIRKNSTQTVAVPEWQRNISVNPIDSPVAYAINETRGNIITIQAKFQLAFPVTLTTEIRAVPQTPHVLGEVQGKQVTFLPTGETNFETFELQNVQIWDNSVGVGNHDITWMWQFRLQPANPWTDFVTSQHRIYAVLEVPKLPWQQMPFDSSNTQLPWTDVLEYACGWASGAINLDDAATKVTTEVYNLGTSILEYDCPGGGGTHYAFPDFNCTAFLERLGGGAGAGRYVNCSDCATIVSTFANILGCDLWQSRMGNSFDLNPILAIGSSTWQTACGWGGFSYHEVAWKGACTSSEEVFDACLQVDGDADPTAPPHTPLQPTNLRFGNIGDGQYRDRLAADTPTGRSNCRPQPSTRMRRRIV